MRLIRRLGIALSVLAIVYITATAALYIAMRQPPERFGAIMSRVPMPAMMILPFRPLWMSARAGHLAVGDRAPDFTLPTTDQSRIVRLSERVARTPCSAYLRQLYLTAISPGGSRAESAVPVLPGSSVVLCRVYPGGASHRSVAVAIEY